MPDTLSRTATVKESVTIRPLMRYRAKIQTMRAFEIHLNGELLCIAAFPGDGTLVAGLDHIYQEEPVLETKVRVIGIPNAVLEHIYFAERLLKTGDQLLIKIVETDSPTDPVRRRDVSIPYQG
jgi:hypothetical protein